MLNMELPSFSSYRLRQASKQKSLVFVSFNQSTEELERTRTLLRELQQSFRFIANLHVGKFFEQKYFQFT
jgi:hypothetical protein